MKKLLAILLFACCFFSTVAYADIHTESMPLFRKRVHKIANTMINANNLPSGIIIRVSNSDQVNAYATGRKEICVYRGMQDYVDNDDELAGVIAHEMGHIFNKHALKQTAANLAVGALSATLGVQRTSSSPRLLTNTLSRSEEFEADLTAVDLMNNSGYNPLAYITIMSKIGADYIDFYSTHPSSNKRLVKLYEYIDTNYPEWVKKGYDSEDYKRAYRIIQQNINNRSELQKQNVSNQKQKYKKDYKKRTDKLAIPEYDE